jgi:hypothetical protein
MKGWEYMLHQVVTGVSLESFHARAQGYKVILLYPWTNYRNLFLSHFLQSAKEGVLYYRVPENLEGVNTWLSDLVEEFNAVGEGFGKKTETVASQWYTGNLGRGAGERPWCLSQ